jgi:hypothetical protein
MLKRAVLIAALAACGSSNSTFARYPGAPAAFDRAASDPKAVAIAEQVFAAAGGPGAWDKAKQLRWQQVISSDGKVTLDVEQGWDRWNGRHHGRLHHAETDLVVGYDLYGSFAMGYLEVGGKKQRLDDPGRDKAVATTKTTFNVDTAVLAMQFLMLEPGAKLQLVGPAKDAEGNETADDLLVTFGDPLRSEIEFHAIIDRTSHLPIRIEVVKGTQKVGYGLADWTTVEGLKFATTRSNLGLASEKIAIKNLRVGDPEEELYVLPLIN